ncbi:MAG: C39 family peptidase [Candidatus Sericytochromatia bacterium]
MSKNLNHDLLGQLLLRVGLISKNDIDYALKKQSETKKPIGEIFKSDFKINNSQIQDLVSIQKFQEDNKAVIINDKIGQVLKKIGFINQKQVNNILEEQKISKKLFGNIMLEKEIISEKLFEDIVKASSGNEKSLRNLKNRRIGELLVDLRYINQNQINECLSEQNKSNKKIGEIALQKGFLIKKQLEKVVNIQKKIASLLIVSVLSTNLLVACGSPRVGNFATIDNYSDSKVVKALNDNPSKSVNYYQDGTISIADIPFYQQGNNNTCGQAVMTAVLNYWGVDITYQTVVNKTNSWNMFTDVDKITKFIRQNGVYAQDYRLASLSFLKDRIRKGWPVIVLLDFGDLTSEHYVIVRGYNDSDREFIILDPIEGPNVKVKYDAFENMWENRSLQQIGLFGDKYKRIAFDIGGN